MTNNVRRIGALSLMLAGATILSACDDVVEEITADDRPVLKMVVGPGAAVLPSGSLALSDIGVVDFQLDAADAFGRGGEEYAYLGGSIYSYGPSDIQAGGTDQRSPVTTGSGLGLGAYCGGCFRIDGPESSGGDSHNWWGSITGLTPGTYWVGQARMGVNTSGTLDQTDMLRNGSIASPDQLVYVGGAPGGDGTRPASDFNIGAPYFAEPNANPWVLGTTVAGADGEAIIDYVYFSQDASGTAVYYTTAEGHSAARSPVGTNANGTFGSGQYNYVVVWDADPLVNANANVVFRLQVGADLDGSSMTTLNNAFAPFPNEGLSALDLLAAPGGEASGAFGVPNTISLAATGLSSLGSMSYNVWLYGAGSYTSAGTILPTDGAEAISLDLTSAATGLNFADFSHVVLTPESGSPASASSAGFLFKEYLTSDNALDPGDMTFGSFGQGGDDTSFAILGAGAGEFFKDSLFIDLSRVGPPPSGFHYQSFLVAGSGGSVRLHEVTLDVLGNGQDRIAASEAGGDFGSYNFYALALEPDGGSVLTEMQIQASEDYAGKFSEFFTR